MSLLAKNQAAAGFECVRFQISQHFNSTPKHPERLERETRKFGNSQSGYGAHLSSTRMRTNSYSRQRILAFI